MEFLKSTLIKITTAILGVAIVLAWWSFRGPPSGTEQRTELKKIPAQMWEGGENVLLVKATTTGMGSLHVSMEGPDPQNKDKKRWSEATEEKSPGQYEWTIHFPKDTKFGTVEWDARSPNVGDKLEWEVFLNNKSIQKDEMQLDKPLEPNTSMFLQVELDEFLADQNTPGDSTEE